MKIRKLQLENFRSYESYVYEFSDDKNFTVLVGENGKGKTNFLEAVYVLSLGRSFRTLQKDDLVKWENDYLRCKGSIESGDEESSLEVFYAREPARKRNFKFNEVNKKNSEYIGNLLTVLFHPEDLNMLYLSPQYRRQYMDILLSQTDKKYLYALSQYRKVLKQRNALLHSIREKRFKNFDTAKLENDLTAWDQQIIKFGTELVLKRRKLVEFLGEHLQNLYRSISGKNEKIESEYMGKIDSAEGYADLLHEKRNSEIFKGHTKVGPHLDDLEFKINDIEISRSASRGEFRTLLLAIKLGEIKYIEEKTGEKPVLLLDDVFSELDESRQKKLINAIKGCQTIITTTNMEKLTELHNEGQNIGFVSV